MAKKQYDSPPPPDHLSPEMQDLWREIFRLQRLQPFQIPLLRKALEAHDRAEQCRMILDKEGLTFIDKHGQPRARPECNIEVLSRAQFQKMLVSCGADDRFFDYERHQRKG